MCNCMATLFLILLYKHIGTFAVVNKKIVFANLYSTIYVCVNDLLLKLLFF
jgi:hypothetical protein